MSTVRVHEQETTQGEPGAVVFGDAIVRTFDLEIILSGGRYIKPYHKIACGQGR